MQDLEVQLAALNELKSFLEQFKEEMRDKSVEFMSRFGGIRESGLHVQFAENYEANYADPALQNIRNLIADITDRHLPYVNSIIAQAEKYLEQSRMGS